METGTQVLRTQIVEREREHSHFVDLKRTLEEGKGSLDNEKR